MSSPLPCPICGKPLAPGAPHGLCPACLLKAGVPTGTAAPFGTRGRFVPPHPAELAQHFPQLEILALIGQGGMGAVYRARQPSLDRRVALKILPPQTAGDPGFAERFTREARALARLSHANIVAVHDFGQAGAFPYLLMEFVDGVNLRHLLAAGKLTPAEAIAIVPPICDALQYAHDRGIVHRDIKPENILLGKNGAVKIADFGLAKLIGADATANLSLTGARDVMGTPYYMAPEQVERPLEVDHRADIYSLGVVFYQMLTGELPLGRFAPPSRKVTIDVRLDEVVLRALEQAPEQRYQQANALKTEIETIGANRKATKSAEVAPAPMAIRVLRWVAVGLMAVCALNAAFFLLFQLGCIALAAIEPSYHDVYFGTIPETIEVIAPFFLWRSSELLVLLSAPALLLSVVGLSGSCQMYKLGSVAWAAAGATVGLLLPLTFPLGFPVGIGAWWWLQRTDIRSAFAMRKSTDTSRKGSSRALWLGAVALAISAGGLALIGPILSTVAASRSPTAPLVEVESWLIDRPDTIQLTAENFDAARNLQLSGVASQRLSGFFSIPSGSEKIFYSNRLQPWGGPQIGFKLTLSITGPVYSYSLSASLDPTRGHGKRVITHSATHASPDQPIILELGSYATGRMQNAVFIFRAAGNSTSRRSRILTAATDRVEAPQAFPLTAFDTLDSDPNILREQLRLAEASLSLSRARFDAGLSRHNEVLSAEQKVLRLKAKLTNDRLAFAQVDVEAAKKAFEETRARRASGLATDQDAMTAESELRIAEIRLRQEENRTLPSTVAIPPSGLR